MNCGSKVATQIDRITVQEHVFVVLRSLKNSDESIVVGLRHMWNLREREDALQAASSTKTPSTSVTVTSLTVTHKNYYSTIIYTLWSLEEIDEQLRQHGIIQQADNDGPHQDVWWRLLQYRTGLCSERTGDMEWRLQFCRSTNRISISVSIKWQADFRQQACASTIKGLVWEASIMYSDGFACEKIVSQYRRPENETRCSGGMGMDCHTAYWYRQGPRTSYAYQFLQ